jgi:glycosyltransferase involved in cell wall biosynthesis
VLGKGDTIRVGVFGRMRHQKHHACSAAVVALMARRNPTKPVVLYINQDDKNPGAESIAKAVKQIAAGIPNLTVQTIPWQSANEFRKTIAGMDLCIQLSATETFNLVTADAAAAGVPSVVGEAIDWVPRDWVAPVDDAIAAAAVAEQLLADETAGHRGQEALLNHAESANRTWLSVLEQSIPESL